MRVLICASLAAAVVLPTAAGAQQVRAGAEFRANDATTGIQRRPDVAIKANGDFIVAWAGVNPLDASNYGVFARRYDVLGAPQGTEFRVNTFTTGFQFRPLVASDAKSNFVVVWGSDAQDGSGYGVFAQRYAADGTPRGGEFMVNTYTTGGQGASYNFLEQNTGVAMAPNGNFVVVWGSYNPGQDGSLSSVHGQRFDGNGIRQGGEFQINTVTTGYQVSPTVAMADDSSFVVVWTTDDGSGYGIAGQRYDAGGNRLGGEFLVPVTTAPTQQVAPVVRSRADKGFTVTWTEAGEVVGRQFNPDGTPAGGQFQVNTTAVGDQYAYSVGMDRRGNFIVNWNIFADGDFGGVGRRRFRFDAVAREAESSVPLAIVGTQREGAVASDEVGNVLSAWTDDARDGNLPGIFAQRFGGLRPSALRVDTTGNTVLEPGETVDVRPTWHNVNGLAQTFAGTLGNITGPAGATYAVTDAAGSYGTVAHNANGPCIDCYAVSVSNPTVRPATHWDASAVEAITPDTQGQHKIWALHVGNSFTDVAAASPFYRFVETLLHHGVTGGCTATEYCPASPTTREQMAVFVLVGKDGPGVVPPACTTPVFNDVPASSPFCRWIEELVRRGVVTGCGGGNYCPAAHVTREQMAVFVLRTHDPALVPPPCAPPNTYLDVPETSPFCRWIEELTRRGVVTGCGSGNYCPAADVTREQMGVFISVTFGLALYGP